MNLKYIFPKCFKYLKKQFFEQFEESSNPIWTELTKKQKNLDIRFYNFYFDQISKSEHIRLEKFFVFRNWTHRHNANIPKTITLETIDLWKKNKAIVDEMVIYLERYFIMEVKEVNKLKINSLIKKWTQLAIKNGLEKAVEIIIDYVKSKRSKLPWTKTEVERGIDLVLMLLK